MTDVCESDEKDSAAEVKNSEIKIETGGGDAKSQHQTPSYSDDLDPELDALLDDAIKGFENTSAPESSTIPKSNSSANSQASSQSSSVSSGTKVKTKKQSTKKQQQQAQGIESLLHGNLGGSDFEAEFKKLLSSEAAELGDLLASEFEKAMTDQGSAQESLFSENDLDDQASYEDQLCRKMEQLTKEMEKTLHESTSTSGKDHPHHASGVGPDEFEKVFGDLLPGLDDGESNFDDVLQDLISSLLDKDILYPSIRELNEKYPPWMAENRHSLSEEDAVRFDKQISIISKICKEYETQPTRNETSVDDGPSQEANSEPDPKSTERIVSLMHEMRELGNPPEALMETIQPEGGANLPGLSSLFQSGTGENPGCPVM